jgi:hypothetical protein
MGTESSRILTQRETCPGSGPDLAEWSERAAAPLECDGDAEALAQSILRALEALGPTHISCLGDHTRRGRGHPTPQRRPRTRARRKPLQHPQLTGFANRS